MALMYNKLENDSNFSGGIETNMLAIRMEAEEFMISHKDASVASVDALSTQVDEYLLEATELIHNPGSTTCPTRQRP